MAERAITWSVTASKQLRKVLEFWIERNGSNIYSLKLLDRIEENLEQVKKYPKKCPETIHPGLRVAAMGHYSIYYRITKNSIRIDAFWDNRQNPKELNDFLKSRS